MSGRPRILDLFCGAGGAAVGLHRAGFDVVGVDRNPDVGKHYPYEFHRGDALAFLAEHGHEFDACHASPPCQDHSSMSHATGRDHGTGWMLAATVAQLAQLDKPYVVENVAGADLAGHFRLVLCGSMFGLGAQCRDGWRQLRRHRQFVTNVFMMQPGCQHKGRTISVAGHTDQTATRPDGSARTYGGSVAERQAAMGIDWMNRDEMSQAIPPVMAEFIGEQLIQHLGVAA